MDDEAEYGALSFLQQILFFGEKLNIPTEHWDDLWKEAHDSGFMVAGAMKADLLNDLREAVESFIEEGKTLHQFRKEFDVIVQTHGWSYRGSRNWRTRIIYETNLRTSYQAGRWAQIQDGKATRPYLLYRHSDASVSPRPLHVAWDGKVLPVDDPFWQSHFPPNGWGCKCRVFALNDRDLERMGKQGPDLAPDDGTQTWTDREGTVHEVPKGVDPGWDYPPGASRTDLLRDRMDAKAERMDSELGSALLAAMDAIPEAPPAPQHTRPKKIISGGEEVSTEGLPEKVAAAPHSYAEFERKPHALVWVDADKFDPAWKASDTGYYLSDNPPAGGLHAEANEIDGRRERFLEWLRTNQSTETPMVWVDKAGKLSFTDGRHRWSVLRDLDVLRIPVTLVADDAAILRAATDHHGVEPPEDGMIRIPPLVLE